MKKFLYGDEEYFYKVKVFRADFSDSKYYLRIYKKGRFFKRRILSYRVSNADIEGYQIVDAMKEWESKVAYVPPKYDFILQCSPEVEEQFK